MHRFSECRGMCILANHLSSMKVASFPIIKKKVINFKIVDTTLLGSVAQVSPSRTCSLGDVSIREPCQYLFRGSLPGLGSRCWVPHYHFCDKKKYPDKSNLWEKGFGLAHKPGYTPLLREKSKRQEVGTVGHITSTVQLSQPLHSPGPKH